jgi:hypothetical protein
MPEQIALLEVSLIDASDRTSLSMVHEFGDAQVLGRPAKLYLTVQGHRLEIKVDKRVYTVSVRDLMAQAVAAVEADLRAKVAARALAAHGSPDSAAAQAVRAVFAQPTGGA